MTIDPSTFLQRITPGPPLGCQMHTVAQVAERLGVSQSLVYAEIKRGRLKAHQLARCLRVSQDQLDAYLAECQVQADSPAVPDQQTGTSGSSER